MRNNRGNNNNNNNNNSNNNNSNSNSNNNNRRRNSNKQNNFHRRFRNNQDFSQKEENKKRTEQSVPENDVHTATYNHKPQPTEQAEQHEQLTRPETDPANLKKCTLCNKVISEMSMAIKHNNQNDYIHFDCAVKDIREKEKPYPNEKICYLGKGSFGIIKFLNYSSGPIKFLIKKRIQYETLEY